MREPNKPRRKDAPHDAVPPSIPQLRAASDSLDSADAIPPRIEYLSESTASEVRSTVRPVIAAGWRLTADGYRRTPVASPRLASPLLRALRNDAVLGISCLLFCLRPLPSTTSDPEQ